MTDAVRNNEGDDDGLLNQFDHRFIHAIRLLIRRAFGFKANEVAIDPASRAARHEVLERFVLALSDQQIITGLALSSLGFAKHCSLSTYHFLMIVSLVWFSSTTHLSTLSLLQRYLAKAPLLKWVRLAGMFALYSMLVMGLVVMFTDTDIGVSLQCRLRIRSVSVRHFTLRSLVAILLFMLLSAAYFIKFVKLCMPAPTQKIMTSESRRIFCRRRIESLVKARNWPQIILQRMQVAWILFSYVYLEFLDSFLWQITWLFFGMYASHLRDLILIYESRKLIWDTRVILGTFLQQPNFADHWKRVWAQLWAIARSLRLGVANRVSYGSCVR